METDIFVQLHEDHWRVDDLIRQWMGQGHGEGRTTADQVSDLLFPHMKAEEIGLYAALREHEEARSQVAQAVEEHRVIEYQVRELVHVTPGHQEELRAHLKLRSFLQQGEPPSPGSVNDDQDHPSRLPEHL